MNLTELLLNLHDAQKGPVAVDGQAQVLGAIHTPPFLHVGRHIAEINLYRLPFQFILPYLSRLFFVVELL